MSISIRLMTLVILLCSSLEALAQEKSYQYQLDGTYPANLPGLSSAQNIRFTINWNEKKMSSRVYIKIIFSPQNLPSLEPAEFRAGFLASNFPGLCKTSVRFLSPLMPEV